MKDAYYFPHDYYARHDPKVCELLLEMGPEGVGIYWCMVEMLYENGGELPLSKCHVFAQSLHTTPEKVQKVVEGYELFVKTGAMFTSRAVMARLKKINAKRWKAKVSANKRWNANAMPTQCEGNARKERKGKERKEKKEKNKTPAASRGLNDFAKNKVKKIVAERQHHAVGSEANLHAVDELITKIAQDKSVNDPNAVAIHRAEKGTI